MKKKSFVIMLNCMLVSIGVTNAQVTIGSGDAPDASAVLELKTAAKNKGFLGPRVSLKSSTDQTTVSNPAEGLLVYNTGTDPNFATTGYMFWDGTAWKIFASSTAEAATAKLNCEAAAMSPAQQVVGNVVIIPGTVLQIPYSGSNGGSFNDATLVSKDNPDVKATISSGMLSVGNGVLNFTLTGTPTIAQQAPTGIVFDLQPFLDANPQITGCNEVIVGNTLDASIETSAVMGYLALATDNTGNDVGTSGYVLQCDSPNGKYSVRVRVTSTVTTIAINNQNINIQIRNNDAISQTVIWNWHTIHTGGMVQNSNMLTIPSRRWGGDNNSGNTWYNATDTGNYGGYLGNQGIYDGNGPEYRRYTWIPLGPENKVSYEIRVMAAIDSTTPSTAVSPTKLKVYIKFDQITAM